MSTIFKRIIDREIPADVIYEDVDCLAFRDIAPKAPVHFLVIPKKEVRSIEHLGDDDAGLLGRLWIVIRNLARQEGLADRGYRVVVNCGADGGQTVDHLHFHVLGGRGLDWPPG